jgi:hypothetical protein
MLREVIPEFIPKYLLAMDNINRILIFGREQQLTDEVTRVLEAAGFIVTGTLDEGVAIDLVGGSGFEALLIGGEVSPSDRRYVATKSRDTNPSLTVVVVQSPESVLTQLRQAGISIR